MSEYELAKEMLAKVTRIEAMVEAMKEKYEPMTEDLKEATRIAIIAEQSAKSAHHRIDTMYIIAGIIGGVVSFIVGLFQR